MSRSQADCDALALQAHDAESIAEAYRALALEALTSLFLAQERVAILERNYQLAQDDLARFTSYSVKE